MPSKQETSFCFQEARLLRENMSERMCVPTSSVVEKSSLQLAVSETLSHGLKNLKIELPRVHIPNEVLFKHEIDRYMKLFQCKEKPAHVSSIQKDGNGSSLQCFEVNAPHSKLGLHYEDGLNTSAKILNFSCTKCRNNIRYSPNDLQKHFQLLHHGELPSYPCEMCNFSANDFQVFNQHRRTHRSTLVKCEVCNDDQTYTLLDLTKHFTSKHCVNGHFQCVRCRFSTHDVGTFVQHMHRHNEIQYKCDKCHHVSFSEEELQKHTASHTGTFPFSCQYCNYMASRKNYLLKHIITLHRDHFYVKHKMDADNNEKRMKTSTGLKLILKRYKTGASRKALWRRKKIISSSCRIGEGGQVLKDTMEIKPNSEELGQSAKELQLNAEKIALYEKQIYSDVKSSPSADYNRTEEGLGSGLGLLKKAVHGPTVLMVKNNKISVPANYSAKFMGFKMVDGKQHIVIKLLPTDKQNFPAGNKVDDGVKDGSTEYLQQTSDNFNLPSDTGPHKSNQQVYKNNSVYSLISSPVSYSSHHPGKIKQENTTSLNWNTSQSVAPAVGDCLTQLPVKPSSSLTSDLVAKARTHHIFSWRNYIPQDHPQVLPNAGTHMLHYDPMKKTFPPELRVLNGEVNYSSKQNNIYHPTPDVSNQAPLPFHNYSKMEILDKSKNLTSSKTIPLQNRSVGETTPCFSQSATGLNLEKKTSYGFVHTNNDPVFSANLPNYVIDRQHCIENHDGRRYLNTKLNQVLERVTEISKPEKASSCINSVMPKITSVFSLQGNQASTYLSSEANQSLQDVLKGKPTPQSHNYMKTTYQSFPNSQIDYKMATCLKESAVLCNLTHSAVKFKREPDVNGSTTNENLHFRNEGRVPTTSLKTEETNSDSRMVGIGTLLKTQADTIITQQLAKDKMRYSIHHSNSICPTLPEQKKQVLFHPSPPRFFVPLRLAQQSGLQVISGNPSSNMNSLDAQALRSTTTSLLINKGSGMILTLGSGSLGTIANATENNSQVLEKCASKENGKEPVSSSEMELKIDCCRSVRNSSCVNVCCGVVSASSIGQNQKEQLNSINQESRIPSAKILPGYHHSKVAPSESIKQPEFGQEPVYALLPNGRQAVFLKCMSPNKSLVQNHHVSQSSADSQNTEPKKPEAMQQKLFLKIKTLPAVDNCQSVNKLVSSLQFNSMHSLNRAVVDQEKTAVSTSNALLLPGRLKPANACSTSVKSKDLCASLESVHSSKHAKAWTQNTPSDSAQRVTANKASSMRNQTSAAIMKNKISKVKRLSKQTGAKVSNAAVSQKNRNLKRKAKEDFQEPPRKKTLHRKCKQKNQMDANEFEPLLPAPCEPRLSKDTKRILKLLPFNSKQLIKCPRRNQPVVVLNHPDADVPEVVNVMKTIAKFKGHVLKVSLSKRTIDALLEPAYYSDSLYIISDDPTRRKRKMLKPVSPVKERFVLKLTLKKTSKNNYQIVKTTSDNTLKTKFSCWFCGRIFDNQDNWVGHGQRHLMEATRDWNLIG